MPLTAALHNVLSSLEKQSLASCLNLNLAVILATCHTFGRVLFSSIIANSFTAAAKGVPVGPIIYYFLFSLSAPVLQNLRLRHIDTIEEGNARHSIFLLLRNDYMHCTALYLCIYMSRVTGMKLVPKWRANKFNGSCFSRENHCSRDRNACWSSERSGRREVAEEGHRYLGANLRPI